MLTLLITGIVSSEATIPEFVDKTEFTITGSFPAHPNPAPCFADWDGDGLLYSACIWKPKKPIRVYLNQGTRGEPVFTDYFTIKCNGKNWSAAEKMLISR